jgi:hypothetical protein
MRVLYGFVTVLTLGLTFYALLDAVLSDADEVRNLPKPLWVLVILLLPLLGAIVWLVGGRPSSGAAAPGGRGTDGRGAPGAGRPGAGRGGTPRGDHPSRGGRGPRPQPGGGRPGGPTERRPRGPDDDPEFLRRLDEQLRRDDDR